MLFRIAWIARSLLSNKKRVADQLKRKQARTVVMLHGPNVLSFLLPICYFKDFRKV